MATAVSVAQREAAQKQEIIDRLAALEASVKRIEALISARFEPRETKPAVSRPSAQ